METKNAELSSKHNCDSLTETKFTNSKEENEISIKIQTAKQQKNKNQNENNLFISSIKQKNQIQMSALAESFSKRLLTEDSQIDLNFIKRNSSTSANFKNDRMSITTTEDAIILPVQDFYDEFNKEIILTDYFSRFLSLSISIYEDEINESNLANFKNNNSNNNVGNSNALHSQHSQNLNLHMNRSNIFNWELEEYDNMKKKANVNLTKNEKQDVNHHLNASNFVPKHRNSSEIQTADNPLFNRQIQYREFNKKNIPERFKSHRIGKIFLEN